MQEAVFQYSNSNLELKGKYVFCPCNIIYECSFFSSSVYILAPAPVMELNMCTVSIYCQTYDKSCLLLAISRVVLLAALAVWMILTLT